MKYFVFYESGSTLDGDYSATLRVFDDRESAERFMSRPYWSSAVKFTLIKGEEVIQ